MQRPWLKSILAVALTVSSFACDDSTDNDAPAPEAAAPVASARAISDPIRKALYDRTLVYDATLDADGLAELWHPQGTVQIGSRPAVTGRENIRGFFAGFFAGGAFTKLEHEMIEVWDAPDALVYNATAIYTLADGGQVRVPYVNVVKYRDGLFFDYRVFIDPSPLAPP
ncbi:MAG TPA: nuclear transport factor 2 family protein [Polyangiaceae bacterium]|nr:nuclear transport factor 2 family protein [Polyangiaceae bacterium]